jgi:hypothetical protein
MTSLHRTSCVLKLDENLLYNQKQMKEGQLHITTTINAPFLKYKISKEKLEGQSTVLGHLKSLNHVLYELMSFHDPPQLIIHNNSPDLSFHTNNVCI